MTHLLVEWLDVMGAEKPRSAEAFALERVAAAAREVQAASTALQAHFAVDGGWQPSPLELARFALAMQELKDAREAFDMLMAGGTYRRSGAAV